eukprot:g22188.t1
MFIPCKKMSLSLQFEKAEYIHSIDIGNEGSAFVEVLVGNSTSACEQDFEVSIVLNCLGPVTLNLGVPAEVWNVAWRESRPFGQFSLCRFSAGTRRRVPLALHTFH